MYIVSWLWSQKGSWPKYTPEDIYRLKQMVEENTTVPHTFICFHDGSFGPLEVESYPLPQIPFKSNRWPESKYPQCFNRLWCFTEECWLPRFISIDADCLITGNIDHILNRKEDFVINKGSKKNGYSGSMWLLEPGTRPIEPTQELIDTACKKYTGSDQAVIRYCYPNEKMFEPRHGIYHYHYWKKDYLPEDCKIMFFAGRNKAKDLSHEWLRTYY